MHSTSLLLKSFSMKPLLLILLLTTFFKLFARIARTGVISTGLVHKAPWGVLRIKKITLREGFSPLKRPRMR